VGERTEHAPGTFSWVELATSDQAGATSFYTSLLGWEADAQPIPGGGGDYTFLKKNGLEAAALHAHLPDGVPPNWTSYVTVHDADAATEKARELGATPAAGPFDVGQAGRMAVLQDPQGAAFAVWQPKESIGARLVNDPGSLTMNQLNASSPQVAQDFYSDLFGWRFDQVSEEPPYWGIYNGDRLNGGMMPLPEGDPSPSHWLVYFTTSDLDGDNSKIAELGGQVVVPPMPIPAGRFLVARDPQGAFFALFEGEVDD
jgi:predicted enzyme related to lactoylglutathione lyase